MRSVISLVAVGLAALAPAALARPATKPPSATLPVVLWHGMGDSGDSDGMASVASMIQDVAGSDVYVASISLGDDDKRASFFGEVNEQVDAVCELLAEDAELQGGFIGIGFSQGGQFLRAYAERCNDPPLKTLITFGAQHMGVASLPGCPDDDSSVACSIARNLALRAVYSDFVQSRVVQAQYFKDVSRYDEYLEKVKFLPDINNEGEEKNDVYKKNLASLDKLVLIMFTNDTTVIPKESAWFSFYDLSEEKVLTPMRDLPIYKEDWIGLKALDKAKKIDFVECVGGHMQISEDFFTDVVRKYIGNGGGKGGNGARRFVTKTVRLGTEEALEIQQ
ncbi:alpha/beta-hydrolase [Hyaloraphidium curvatum]|nr:alpha/beta-hydrolase [Hyaloraphidium curvatum]